MKFLRTLYIGIAKFYANATGQPFFYLRMGFQKGDQLELATEFNEVFILKLKDQGYTGTHEEMVEKFCLNCFVPEDFEDDQY